MNDTLEVRLQEMKKLIGEAINKAASANPSPLDYPTKVYPTLRAALEKPKSDKCDLAYWARSGVEFLWKSKVSALAVAIDESLPMRFPLVHLLFQHVMKTEAGYSCHCVLGFPSWMLSKEERAQLEVDPSGLTADWKEPTRLALLCNSNSELGEVVLTDFDFGFELDSPLGAAHFLVYQADSSTLRYTRAHQHAINEAEAVKFNRKSRRVWSSRQDGKRDQSPVRNKK